MKTVKPVYSFQLIGVDTPALTSNCNSITFWNRGAAIVTIDGVITLKQDEMFSLNNDENAIIEQNFSIVFSALPGFLIIIKETK